MYYKDTQYGVTYDWKRETTQYLRRRLLTSSTYADKRQGTGGLPSRPAAFTTLDVQMGVAAVACGRGFVRL